MTISTTLEPAGALSIRRLTPGLVLSSIVPDEITAEAKAIEEDTPQGVGSLTDFDPYSKTDWPSCGGVYVLYDRSERPVYVGKVK